MKYFVFILFVIYSLGIAAQTNIGIKTVDINGEKAIDEEQIEAIAYDILNSSDNASKDSLNTVLKQLLQLELSKEGAMQHPFSKVKSMAILIPKDSSFRIFNWNIPYSNGSYSYECGILNSEGDFSFLNPKNDTAALSGHGWIPALYYSIIEKQDRYGKNLYTLLAWKGNDRLTNKKVIDVLWFNNSGEIQFGYPIFQSGKKKLSRIVFEYAAQNVMSLHYNSNLDRIQFDHLSPPRQSLNGIFEYYGPDLSYDAYQWVKNHWELDQDIDLDQGLAKKKADFKLNKDVILEETPVYSPKH